jgi:hypothetical protein
MLILVYLSVGRKDIMKTGYTVFYIFESARLQGEALHRRWDCTGGRCTAYGIVQAVAVPPMGLYRRSLYRLCMRCSL